MKLYTYLFCVFFFLNSTSLSINATFLVWKNILPHNNWINCLLFQSFPLLFYNCVGPDHHRSQPGKCFLTLWWAAEMFIYPETPLPLSPQHTNFYFSSLYKYHPGSTCVPFILASAVKICLPKQTLNSSRMQPSSFYLLCLLSTYLSINSYCL